MSVIRERSGEKPLHLGIMLIGCLVMVLALQYLGTGTAGSGSLGWIMVAACPLMHVYIMFSMRGKDHSDEDDTCHQPANAKMLCLGE